MHMAIGTFEGRGGSSGSAQPPRFDFSAWTELPPLPGEVQAAEGAGEAERAEGAGLPDVGLLERGLALAMLVPLSPFMALVALAIKVDSPGGPVLFRQERVGLDRRRRTVGADAGANAGANAVAAAFAADRRRTHGVGRPFGIYKFRTMIPNAEGLTGPVWATERDPRITRLGRLLRRLRVDEIPQFINVLKGEMRLIGPRPERPHFVDQLVLEIPGYAERQKVPPGITGLAQVKRHYDASVQDVRTKVKYDVYYVNNRGRLLDLKIMIKTIDVMLLGRGAR
jgi:lipopolysaccharide/colanic/teichoic acid biosynthesis glycosyltransferase